MTIIKRVLLILNQTYINLKTQDHENPIRTQDHQIPLSNYHFIAS